MVCVWLCECRKIHVQSIINENVIWFRFSSLKNEFLSYLARKNIFANDDKNDEIEKKNEK